MKRFSIILWEYMGYKTISLEKNLDEVIEQVNKHLEMMNYLTRMKIARENLLSIPKSMFYAQRLLDGVLNHFAVR